MALGLFSAVLLLSGVVFLTGSLRAEAARAKAAMPDILVQRLVGGRPRTIATDAIPKIHTLPSVDAVVPRVWGYVFVPALQGNVTVVGVHEKGAMVDYDAAIGEGRDLAPRSREMVMGRGLARFLGLRIGDEIALPAANPAASSLRLVGTFTSSVDLYTADVLLCDDIDARLILGVPAEDATDLAVHVRNPEESRVLARKIAEILPGARVIDRESLERVYDLAYGRRAGLVLAASLPALLALFVLAWDRLSGALPEEKREIAILKAVGFSTGDVLRVKILESFLVSLVAVLAGIIAAYAWVFVLGAPGLRPALVGWSVLYPEAPLTPAIDVADVLAIALSIMGPYLLVSVVPAWRAATADPMDVMRA
jgi:ABC-type lipoprotein release transport system permease subunit